jgi:predicted DNA-binding transcriptional regulator AlpA
MSEPMKTFEFSIVASGLDHEAEGFADLFFDAGCDDSTVSFQKGHIILDFAREAKSLAAAIASAVEDVRKAGATVNRVEPDPLVSLSDMASRAGMSRSALTLYAKGARGRDFPAPIARVTSESPLWDWATVARWMFENEKLDKQTALDADTVSYANAAIREGGSNIGAKLKKRAEDYAKELKAA